MDRMKTFFIYALCIILFFVYSNVMININCKIINSNIKSEETSAPMHIN